MKHVVRSLPVCHRRHVASIRIKASGDIKVTRNGSVRPKDAELSVADEPYKSVLCAISNIVERLACPDRPERCKEEDERSDLAAFR